MVELHEEAIQQTMMSQNGSYIYIMKNIHVHFYVKCCYICHNIKSQDIIHWNDNENKVEMFLIKIFLIVEDMQESPSQDSGATACHSPGKHTLFHGPEIPGGYTVTLQSGQQIMIQQLQKLQQNSSSPTLSTPIASSSAHQQVLPMETLTSQKRGHWHVIGNSVNIKDTNMSNSNKNCSYMENVVRIHVHFCVKGCHEYI